jgi:uncharacterized protein (DUF3084 family)
MSNLWPWNRTKRPETHDSPATRTITPLIQQNGLDTIMSQLDQLRTDYATLRAEHTVTRSELGAARQELGESKAFIASLQRITGTQDNMLTDLSVAQSSTQTQLNQALQDKQYQAIQIRDLQSQVTILKNDLAHSNEQLAINNGMRQGLQLAVDELKRENTRLIIALDSKIESERGT